MANQYTNDEWGEMITNVPTAPMTPPTTTLNTNPAAWNQLVPATDNTQADMNSIKGLFDRLAGVVTDQRGRRVATKTYVVELEKLINKLRECIEKLLTLLEECKQNKLELAKLRQTVSSHPNLNVIREQLTNSITEMERDKIDPDDFRKQLVALVAEIKKICDAVDNMRRAEFGGDDGDGNPGGNPGDGETKIDTRLEPVRRHPTRPPPATPYTSSVASLRNMYSGEPAPGPDGKIRTREQGIELATSMTEAAEQGKRNRHKITGETDAAYIRRTQKKGGWQTPEKLQSLSKSKPIRTLDSIKRKKSKRGNKSKRRRKKTKRRRNKKKKQTKRERNKKRKKKITRKR